MSDDLKEIVEGINKTFGELRSEQESIKGKVDALDDQKFDRMVEDITSKLEDVQKEQAKIKAAVSRPEGSEKLEAEDFTAKSKDAFATYFKTGEISEGFKVSGDGIEVRAMSTDVNPDGGYLVRPELANFVVDRVFESSPLRQVARVETIGSKSLEVLIDDNEAGARWVGEGASGGETSTPQLGLKEIVAHKIEADPRITTEQLQDSFLNVEQWLQSKVADKFARTQNTAFVNGDGVNKPRGFLSYPAAASSDTYERNALGRLNLGGTAFSASAVADGLIELKSLLKEEYQMGAVFATKRASFGSILKNKGNDNYFFSQTLLKDGQEQPLLLGKPVIFMDDMPTEASAAVAIAYGNFSVGYTIVDRVGLQVLRDPYTNKGFITYYTTQRVGGDVTNFDSIKLGVLSA